MMSAVSGGLGEKMDRDYVLTAKHESKAGGSLSLDSRGKGIGNVEESAAVEGR